MWLPAIFILSTSLLKPIWEKRIRNRTNAHTKFCCYFHPASLLFVVFTILTIISSPIIADPTMLTISAQVKNNHSQEKTLIQQHRARILSGTYGSTSISDLVQLLTEISGGPEIHEIFQVLAVRKNEAVPIIKEKLRTGQMWEKHMLTKLLRYSPWSEVRAELIAIAQDSNEHWLPRQGALYALGELGNQSAGTEVLAILSEPNCPAGVQLVAISTLARIGYRQAASTISLFTEHEDVHIRLFAYRALAEFNEPVDREFLLSALDDQDYIVRQEACGALAAVEGEDITQRLQSVTEHDFHESVRTVARIGLLNRQICDRAPSEKLRFLRNALEPVERRTAPWIIRTILDKCGPEGRAFVEELSTRDDKIGERARAFLIARVNSSSTSPLEQEIQTEEIEPLHAATPTHQTLMEYAISKAGSLSTPLSFTSTQQNRMKEGAVDEDKTFDILGESLRYLQHGYNPLTNSGFSVFTSAHDRAYNIWNDRMEPYFEQGYLDNPETSTQWGGAWQQLGRVSHLLQDMSSPLHALATEWHILVCEFEEFWANNDPTLRSILNSIGNPLHSGDPLPSEATAKLDSFTQERLQYRYNNNCPQKNNDDVRGCVEVLAWTTYFRVTFWGQVMFGTSGNGTSGSATSSQTTGTTFNDGYVGAKTNTLHTMFNGNVMYIDGWTDNYYEITDRQGYIFIWMSWTDIDDWSSCGRNWANGQKDSSKRIGGSDDDDPGVRITGRFWFDTTQLGKDTSGNYNRRCYPNKYPNGNSMTDDLHLYYGKYGYPLTVRYNAGLLGLANRRVTVETNCGQANGCTWSRKDNFESEPTFNATTGGSHYYFVAKSSVDLTAPETNTYGQSFIRWLKDGSSFSTNRTITINTPSSPIPKGGVIYTAVYNIVNQPGSAPFSNITQTSIQANWTANGNPPGTEYYCENTTEGTNSDWTTNTYWNETGLTCGNSYCYRVKSGNECGESDNWTNLGCQNTLACAVPAISRDPSLLNNTCLEGTDATSQSFEVWNSGTGTLNYTITDTVGWLECSPDNGSSTGGHNTINVNYTTSGLTADNYPATITISDPAASNNPQTIQVDLTVTDQPMPTIALAPTLLTNICIVGRDAPTQSFDVWNSGEATLNYTITDDANWLSCSPSTGQSTGEYDPIDVNYVTSALSTGIYNATITVSDPGASNPSQTVTVELSVIEPNELPPDINNDGIINSGDYIILADHWRDNCFGPSWCEGADLDMNSVVNFSDVNIMCTAWLEIDRELIYENTLDSSPGWTVEGEWAFGQPTGSGGTPNGNPDPSSGYTGNNVYGVNLNGNYDHTTVGGPYYLTAGPFDCNNCNYVQLKFARWLNTDEPEYVGSKIEASNNGIDYQTVWEHIDEQPGQSIEDSDWQIMDMEYDISAVADNQNNVYIRWSYKISDEAYPYSGWNIDDIQLWGNR